MRDQSGEGHAGALFGIAIAGESFQRDCLVVSVEEPEGVEFNNVPHGNSC